MQNKIDIIKQSINLVDLITRFIRLKKIGRNYVAHCPFHNENKPSFIVNEAMQVATCFGGCNKSFDVISFYEHYFNVSTTEAINCLMAELSTNKISKSKPPNSRRELKPKFFGAEGEYIYWERFSIALESKDLPENLCRQMAKDSLYTFYRQSQLNIFARLIDFCKVENDIDAMIYLTSESRGLTNKIIEKFSICSIHKVKSVVEFLKDSFSTEELAISGLFTDSGYFIFSNHKILIPYIENNLPVYIRGRFFYVSNAEPIGKYGKYISLVNRSGTLSPKRFFNIDLLKNLEWGSELLICEGEFDCIVMSQYNYPVIAVPGISNVPEDLSCLQSFKIFIGFDNDSAGNKAAESIVKNLTTNNNQVSIIKFKTEIKDFSEWSILKQSKV
ncbi:MAG: toprim domain-containing protein [Ignavibacteriales bacterium]|nr:MAG: toprim domain-containing protein [Ignavibacteriales bacterium]